MSVCATGITVHVLGFLRPVSILFVSLRTLFLGHSLIRYSDDIKNVVGFDVFNLCQLHDWCGCPMCVEECLYGFREEFKFCFWVKAILAPRLHECLNILYCMSKVSCV
jgi:hypothetical protein